MAKKIIFGAMTLAGIVLIANNIPAVQILGTGLFCCGGLLLIDKLYEHKLTR